MIAAETGKQFDPSIVAAFMGIRDQIYPPIYQKGIGDSAYHAIEIDGRKPDRDGGPLAKVARCGFTREHIMALTITSPAFANGHEIPSDFTCEGADISPALAWSGAPAGTKSLTLIVDDPDAPDPAAPKMTWVHWVLYNLPADSRGLAEAVEPADLPAGTREGKNDWKTHGLRRPVPADRPAPLLLQALRARCHVARPEGPHQGRAREGDAGTHPGEGRTPGPLSEGAGVVQRSGSVGDHAPHGGTASGIAAVPSGMVSRSSSRSQTMADSTSTAAGVGCPGFSTGATYRPAGASSR